LAQQNLEGHKKLGGIALEYPCGYRPDFDFRIPC